MEKTEQQQWQREEEVEQEEEEEVDLQGRRPRHSATTATAVPAVSNSAGDASSACDKMLPSSELANGFEVEECGQDELPNVSKDNNELKVDSQEKSETNVYYDKDEGTESIHGFSATESNGFQESASLNNSGDDGLVVTTQNFGDQYGQGTLHNHQYRENLKVKDGSLSGFKVLPSERSFEERKADKSFNDIRVGHDDIELIKESDPDLAELDLERVLKKQNTHDLFCPNCNSCITRRVILRKRKRNIRISGEDAKRNKAGTVVASELDALSSHSTNDQGGDAVDISLAGSLTPSADEYNHSREPEIFRCLSCLSFFIPTVHPEEAHLLKTRELKLGNGFKMFRIFGDKSEKENMQSPEPISVVKKNWFSSFFVSRKEGTFIEQGNGRKENMEENSVGASKQEVTSPPGSVGDQGVLTISTADDTVPSSMQGPKLLGLHDARNKSSERAALVSPKLDTLHQFDCPGTESPPEIPVNIAKPAENVTFKHQQDGLKILVNLSSESLTHDISHVDQKLNVATEKKNTDDKSSVLLMPNPASAPGESDNSEKVNIVVDLPSENGQDVGDTLPTRSVVEYENMKLTITRNDDIDSVPVMQKPVSLPGESDNNEKVNVVVDPSSENGHDVGDTLPTKSVVEYENMKVIVSGNADKGSVLLMPKSVLVPGESDINQKVNIVADLPSESSQHVGYTLPAKSVVEYKDMEVKISGNDVAYSSEASQHAFAGTKMDILVEKPLKAETVAFRQDALLTQYRPVDNSKDLKNMPTKSTPGSDTIVTIEGPVEPAASQVSQSIIATAETVPLPHTVSAEDTGFDGLDIIKSIVYGGLVESITSLSIVSSAAGADAATLNILALGLANLIGGLFIVGHNLWELKSDLSQVTTQLDRYLELLGRRANFWLHATFVVLSYLVFGLLPPVLYGFSFRVSDNRDYKLIAVAAVSLLCIIMLSTGKAYVQRPPKAYIKTVIYYVITGIMASGVSYAAGDLIKKLLEKFGLFSSGLALNQPLLQKIPFQPGWGSY